MSKWSRRRTCRLILLSCRGPEKCGADIGLVLSWHQRTCLGLHDRAKTSSVRSTEPLQGLYCSPAKIHKNSRNVHRRLILSGIELAAGQARTNPARTFCQE